MELANSSALLIAGICVVLYVTYHMTAFSRLTRQRIHDVGNEYNQVLLQRLSGFFLLGIVSFLLIMFVFDLNTADFGLNSKGAPELFLWWLGVAAVLLPLSYRNAGRQDNLREYPQMRFQSWGVARLVISNLTWLLYLLGYEFMFRGVLWYALYYTFGFWPAIIVNVVLYSLAHLPKNMKETIGAIPMGFLLCYITYRTGSIWAAVLIHGTVALSNEYFSIAHHPEMKFAIGRKS